jgi:hypothetical protein
MSGPAGGRARSDAVMQVTKREGRSFLSLVILSVSAAETQGRAAPRTRFVASGDGKLSWGCIVIREAVELPGSRGGRAPHDTRGKTSLSTGRVGDPSGGYVAPPMRLCRCVRSRKKICMPSAGVQIQSDLAINVNNTLINMSFSHKIYVSYNIFEKRKSYSIKGVFSSPFHLKDFGF